VQRPGSRVSLFSPGYFREQFQLTEEDILFLRNYASSDFADRGVRREMVRIANKAALRVASRMEQLRWQTLLTGVWTYMGTSVDFGVPGGNTITPAVAWDTVATATPMADIRLWTLTTLRKYRIKRMWINQKTANDILATDEVSDMLTAVGGRGRGFINDVNEALAFFVPGAPPFEIYDEWYQDETTTAGVVSVGAEIPFIPDDVVYFEHTPMGQNVGELTVTPNLQNGSLDSPGSGIIWAFNDKTNEPGNPYMEFISGFNGGPRLFRPFDVFTADVS